MAIDTFFGLNIASSGIRTAQKSLSVVNHNLSNASTEGYSRQSAKVEAGSALVSNTGAGTFGTGAEVTTVQRIRDEYLDYKYWGEEASYGEWNIKRTSLNDIEAIFNEPSDSGFSTAMSEFYNSMEELAKDPSSDSIRVVVKERAVSLAKYFNNTAIHLEKIQSDLNNNLKEKVQEINSLAKQIANVNKQISSEEIHGNKSNDLRDRRILLVDKLSKIVNIDAKEIITNDQSGRNKKEFIVTISGKALVDNNNASLLALKARENKLNEEDVDGLYELKWEDGNSLQIKSGEIKGYIDMRDGNETINDKSAYNGIPYYQRKLNEFVRTFSRAVNEGFIDANGNGVIEKDEDRIGHADGYTKNSISSSNPSGIRVFTVLDEDGNNTRSEDFIDESSLPEDDSDTLIDESLNAIYGMYNKMTARNFAISQDLFDNLDNLSTSDQPEKISNSNIIQQIINIRSNKELFAEGQPEDFMKSVIGSLGIDSQQATRITSNQASIVGQIVNRRASDSGVSIDEEMTNLVKFQKTYTASAKMISTMMELYDILINRMGV